MKKIILFTILFFLFVTQVSGDRIRYSGPGEGYYNSKYLKLDGSNADTTIDIGSEDFTTTGNLQITTSGADSAIFTDGIYTVTITDNTNYTALTATDGTDSVHLLDLANGAAIWATDAAHTTKILSGSQGVHAISVVHSSIGSLADVGNSAGVYGNRGSAGSAGLFQDGTLFNQVELAGEVYAINVGTGALTIGDSNATDLAVLATTSDMHIKADDKKMFFGTASDASIYYDGGDLIVNTQEVGGGSLEVLVSNIVAVDGNFQLGAANKGFAFFMPTEGATRFGIKIGTAGMAGDADITAVCNRAPDGEVSIQVDSGAGGAGGEVEAVRYTDTQITHYIDTTVTGDLTTTGVYNTADCTIEGLTAAYEWGGLDMYPNTGNNIMHLRLWPSGTQDQSLITLFTSSDLANSGRLRLQVDGATASIITQGAGTEPEPTLTFESNNPFYFTEDALPDTTSSFDLGTTTYKWRDGRFSRSLFADTSITTYTVNANILGLAESGWIGIPGHGLIQFTEATTEIFNTLQMNTNAKILLRDSAIGIYSQADTFMDLFADGGVRIGDSSAGAPSNYTTFEPDGLMTMTGTARVRRHKEVNLTKMKKGVGSPPGDNTEDEFTTLDFIESGTEEVFFKVHLPDNIDSSADAAIHLDFFVDASPAENQTVKWDIEYKCVEHGDVFDFEAGTFPATKTITILSTSDDKEIHHTDKDDLVIANANIPATGVLLVRLYRDGANDTYDGDARLFNVHLVYVSNRLGRDNI